MDRMDEISDLREVSGVAMAKRIHDHCLGSVMARWNAEYEYWRRLQTCLWDVLHAIEDGDTLPTPEELRPRM